ncbi:MAG TPA: hopanoid biosynthesis-associated protein HpnK [Verrucomicrobiae bacterium]|nr:hopanoid biosynthesis-associated protein HpnK [Verrucomicrobiae bacterium]
MAAPETRDLRGSTAGARKFSPQFPPTSSKRRLIVNADDFGRSHSINEAVIRAHREGILTTASLMVNESPCAEAVELAKQNPQLGVGLHLTLLMGHSALPHAEIPGLVNEAGEFLNDPVKVGFKYFFQRELREQLRKEIHAQFARFRTTGLPLDHVNGHLHLHLHPAVFGILMEDAEALGIERMRLTRDPFWMDVSMARGQRLYRGTHALIYSILSRAARARLEKRKIRHTHRVFGLLQNARVDEAYILKLLPGLPPGDSELYSHPSLDNFKHEFDALISTRVKEQVERLGIGLIRYRDLDA